jgi:UDP-glucose 4-epimerase
MKICVTGGCGFIGSHLVDRFVNDGHQVLVIDNFSVAGPDRLPQSTALTVEELDVRNTDYVVKALQRFNPEAVYHLAAIHFIPYCSEHPLETLKVNVDGTRSMIAAAKESQVQRFIFASSAAVYPPVLDACSESTPPGPTDIYGFSKWMGELLCEQLIDGTKMVGLIARIFNVYGPRETNPHVIPHIVEQLVNEVPIKLGNMKSRRDYIFTEDIVDGLTRLMGIAVETTDTVNIGTGQAYSVQEIIETIQHLLGRKLEVKTREDLLRKDDRPLLLADTKKIKDLTAWHSKHTLQSGLRALLSTEGLLDDQ